MAIVLTPDTFAALCPSRALLSRLADKWVMLVLLALQEGPTRHGALMRRVEGISQKMLTQTLRKLESDGLLERHVFDVVPPHVEYQLTDLGREVSSLLEQLDGWVRRRIGSK